MLNDLNRLYKKQHLRLRCIKTINQQGDIEIGIGGDYQSIYQTQFDSDWHVVTSQQYRLNGVSEPIRYIPNVNHSPVHVLVFVYGENGTLLVNTNDACTEWARLCHTLPTSVNLTHLFIAQNHLVLSDDKGNIYESTDTIDLTDFKLLDITTKTLNFPHYKYSRTKTIRNHVETSNSKTILECGDNGLIRIINNTTKNSQPIKTCTDTRITNVDLCGITLVDYSDADVYPNAILAFVCGDNNDILYTRDPEYMHWEYFVIETLAEEVVYEWSVNTLISYNKITACCMFSTKSTSEMIIDLRIYDNEDRLLYNATIKPNKTSQSPSKQSNLRVYCNKGKGVSLLLRLPN